MDAGVKPEHVRLVRSLAVMPEPRSTVTWNWLPFDVDGMNMCTVEAREPCT